MCAITYIEMLSYHGNVLPFFPFKKLPKLHLNGFTSYIFIHMVLKFVVVKVKKILHHISHPNHNPNLPPHEKKRL